MVVVSSGNTKGRPEGRPAASDRSPPGGDYEVRTWQNSPNASTYFCTSSSVCCTETVHCSSSPGVMKMPRLTIHGYDAQ